MKQKINSIYALTAILILMLLSSCEKEGTNTISSKKNGIISKNVSLKDLARSKVNERLLESVHKIAQLQKEDKGKTTYNNEYDFYIDQQHGKYIETATEQSYTFPVYRMTGDDAIENIVFTLNADGAYDAVLAKYDVTKEELESNPDYIAVPKKITPLDRDKISMPNSSSSSASNKVTAFTCNILVCNNDGHGSSGSTHVAGANCTNSAFLSYMTVTIYLNTAEGGNAIPIGGGTTGGAGSTTNTGGIITVPVSGYTAAQLRFIRGLGSDKYEDFNGCHFIAAASVFTYVNTCTAQQMAAVNYFFNHVNYLWLADQTAETQVSIFSYLIANDFSSTSRDFINQMITVAAVEQNQADVPSLINIALIIEGGNYSMNSLDSSFLANIDPFVDVDLSNQDIHDPLITQLIIKYNVLKALHPEWSKSKLYFETFKDLLHTGLEVFGLAPVIGEPADLINGVIYTLEGDHLNAAFSYSNTIPIFGWVSAGTKYGLKVVNSVQTVYSISTKVKLVWKVAANGAVTFGQQSQLRKVLGMAISSIDSRQAHHLIPWAKQGHEIVQRAAKSANAFHMNEALNGIAVAAWRNQPHHTTYNNLIALKMDQFYQANSNATPLECYDFLTNLIQDIRNWVVNNPNSHLNDLVLP